MSFGRVTNGAHEQAITAPTYVGLALFCLSIGRWGNGRFSLFPVPYQRAWATVGSVS